MSRQADKNYSDKSIGKTRPEAEPAKKKPNGRGAREKDKGAVATKAGKGAATAPVRGLSLSRFFTKPGVDPFSLVQWELRTAAITPITPNTTKAPAKAASAPTAYLNSVLMMADT